MPHPAQLPIETLLKECEFRRTRRSGPGGQHRNKVETAVVVEHCPTRIRAEASERRSQSLNRETAIQRLRVQLALQVRTSTLVYSSDSMPSQLWKSRVVGNRLAVNVAHEDFPALLAEALDTLAFQEFDLPASAVSLGISSSQLVKLLKLEPAALLSVNRHRNGRGLLDLR
ncbi:peptide chain release factor family protein [Bythopirellula polymerisocia]|uniref:Peptide chain release factor 1 n=1 Tax=Bythopirellula polymerisocia TaxID=2528003 RepID=A0A5C6CNP1_9BACT|nr:peptide chain release factor-like protein [Bythopirellula polymerisocia]TWU25998.1 Peptide chain release factor 1 [Bythopirellula polymerisocia]